MVINNSCGLLLAEIYLAAAQHSWLQGWALVCRLKCAGIRCVFKNIIQCVIPIFPIVLKIASFMHLFLDFGPQVNVNKVKVLMVGCGITVVICKPKQVGLWRFYSQLRIHPVSDDIQPQVVLWSVFVLLGLAGNNHVCLSQHLRADASHRASQW